MAALYQAVFGGSKPTAAPKSGDADFADFAGAPDPSPASFSAIPTAASFTGSGASPTAVPWTRWYNVHERHSLSEFKQEGYILIAVGVIVLIHLWGSRTNRAKAKAWINKRAPVLEKEFAVVGFGGRSASSVAEAGAVEGSSNLPVKLLKEKSLQTFSTYATGRQNVAFLDVNLSLYKLYNPLLLAADFATGFFFESMPLPAEKMEAILYPFDGKESLTVPGQIPGTAELRKDKSAYDNFVWAIVNKDNMKQLRDERYDVSITSTKDHPKLPNWCTVMSESAEVTDLLLTPELISAVEEAGELMEYLIITDQPVDRPTTINEAAPKKRIFLTTKFDTSDRTVALFTYMIRLPDLLASSAHFRPEVLRKVRGTREDLVRKLQKADEDEKAEERALEREKAKKLKRDLELKGLDAKAQKKYLEKENERLQKKNMKKQSVRG